MKNTKKAWLVRAYPHGKYRFNEFRENNIVAIGWPGIGSLEYKPLKEELDSILSGDPYNLKGIPRGLASSTITLFINSMNIDDYVLVPIDDNIYIGKIISDYKYQEDKDNDQEGYPHQREVRWMAQTTRTELSDDLRRLLKDRRTAADLSTSVDEIEYLATGKVPKKMEINVNYPLRSDYEISFSIPANITETEASRLSQYIKTLYYDN